MSHDEIHDALTRDIGAALIDQLGWRDQVPRACDNAWPCIRTAPHDQPRGCVHESAWAPDGRHDDETRDQ